MIKNAFDLKVGDIIQEGSQRLKVVEIKGTYFRGIGLMLKLRFARGGYIPKGYATLRRQFNVVGYDKYCTPYQL